MELDLSAGASDDAISKSYKTMARKFHPDKMVKASDADKRVAEARFMRVKTAHDFLVDAVQKALFDDDFARKKKSQAQKAEREGAMDERRRAMKRRLDEGERQEADKQQERKGPAQHQRQHAPSGQQRAREADIRQDNRARRETAGEAQHSRETAASTAAASTSALDLRTLTVKWKRKAHAFGDDDVAALFRPFGQVHEVRLVGAKGNAAVVVLDSPQAAAAAAASLKSSDTMKVTVVGAKASAAPAWASPAAPTPFSAATPLSARDRESVGDFNARRAGERERMAREMESGGREADSAKDGHRPGGLPAPAAWALRPPLSEEELTAKEQEVLGFLEATQGQQG
jgi:curved DNA-binding protein CbpA